MSSPAFTWKEILADWREFLGVLLLEDGRTFYQSLVDEPWRLKLVEMIISPATRIAFADLPRGYGKTTSAAALAVMWLFVRRNTDVFVLAVDKLQAGILFEAACEFLQRTPQLRKLCTISEARGRIVHRVTKSKLEILATDERATFGYGRRPFVVILDEFAHYRTRRVLDPWTTALSKAPGSKIVILTNAGADRSGFAWELREQCRLSEDPALAFFSGAEAGGRPMSLTEEELALQRSLLPAPIFAQYFLGTWGLGGGELLFAPGEVEAIIDPNLDANALQFDADRNYFLGIDLGWKRDRSTLAVLHKERQVYVLDHLATFFGSPEHPVSFEDVFVYLTTLYKKIPRVRRIFCDPWQAGYLMQRATHAGVRNIEEFRFTARSRQLLSQWLFQAVHTGNVRLPDHALLRQELLDLRMVSVPGGGWKFDHPTNGHDDHVMSLALAIGAALPDSGGRVTDDPATAAQIEILAARVQDPRKFGLPRRGGLALVDMETFANPAARNLLAEIRLTQLFVKSNRISTAEANMLLNSAKEHYWGHADSYMGLFIDSVETDAFYGGSIRELFDRGFPERKHTHEGDENA